MENKSRKLFFIFVFPNKILFSSSDKKINKKIKFCLVLKNCFLRSVFENIKIGPWSVTW